MWIHLILSNKFIYLGTCAPCPSLYFCPSKSAPPQKCPLGSYSLGKQMECILAPAGYYIPFDLTNSTPIVCPLGKFSNGGSSVCSNCNDGYLCPKGSTDPAPSGSECPIGGYCNSIVNYMSCPRGTYGILSGGSSVDQACASCEPGYYCSGNGTVLATRKLCLEGGYCPQSSYDVTPCPAGTISNYTGMSTIATCEPCARGTYCPNSGSYKSYSCPANYFCPEGTADYTLFACPSGTFSNFYGLYVGSQCQNCSTGKISFTIHNNYLIFGIF